VPCCIQSAQGNTSPDCWPMRYLLLRWRYFIGAIRIVLATPVSLCTHHKSDHDAHRKQSAGRFRELDQQLHGSSAVVLVGAQTVCGADTVGQTVRMIEPDGVEGLAVFLEL